MSSSPENQNILPFQMIYRKFILKTQQRSCQELIHILIRQRDLEDQEAGVRFQSTYPASTRRPANFRTAGISAGIYPETIKSLVVLPVRCHLGFIISLINQLAN